MSNKIDIFHWTDFLIILLFLVVFILVSIFIRGYKISQYKEYKYYIKALSINVLGGLSFGLIYLFYYKVGGDTFYYFSGARTLAHMLIENPQEYFKLIFSSHAFTADLQYIKEHIYYARSPEEWFMVKLLSPISFLSFNRFLVAQFLMSFVTFFGSWKFMQSFILFYPTKSREAFYSVFLIPSIILWGGGLLKDSLTFSFLGFFFYYSTKVFFFNKIKIRYFLFIILSVYIIFNVKAYIILSFIPVFIIGWLSFKINHIKSNFLKIIIAPMLIVVAVISGFLIINVLQADSQKYAFDKLQSRAEGFHNWHTTLGGSTYSLGDTDYSTLGIVSKIPAAINVTFFRPYITEVNNMALALGAIESFSFLLLFLTTLYWYKFRWLKVVFNSPLLTLSFFYAILFGFIVGFTSYNFGALARYKIPAIPFFVFLLLYLYFEYKNKARSTKEIEDL